MSNIDIYSKSVEVTAPAVEPVTLAEASAHLRTYTTDDNTYIESLIKAARYWVENDLNRKLITQTWTRTLNGWPWGNCIDLPYGKLQSVTHVKYYDTDGTQQTLSSDNYIVSTSETIGKVVLVSDESWPDLRDDTVDSVEVQYVCGYGLAADVPEHIKQAILLTVGHWYENRETVITGTIAAEVPMATKAILSQERIDLV